MITTVTHSPFFISRLFKEKFGHPAPEHGHGLVCFYRIDWSHFVPLCYTNFLPYDEVILVGGAMTDGSVFRIMPKEHRNKIKQLGGIYYQVLLFAFDYFADDCDAFFGHAGDRRAYEIDLKAGFVQTPHQYLIANFHKPISEERKTALIEKIHAIGPF